MREELQRTALLLDELSLQKIQSSKVAVFGIGGVGSYVVEALPGWESVPLSLWTTTSFPFPTLIVSLSPYTVLWADLR